MALCHIEPTGIDITEFSFGRLRNTDQPCAGGRVKYKITVINNGDQDQDIELTEWIGNTYLEDEALSGKTKETVMVKAHSSWVDEREMQVLYWPSAWYYLKVKLTYSLQSTAILSYDAFWLDQCITTGGGGIQEAIRDLPTEIQKVLSEPREIRIKDQKIVLAFGWWVVIIFLLTNVIVFVVTEKARVFPAGIITAVLSMAFWAL